MVKAIRVHELGGPEVLKWEDVEVGEPKEGEVRVKNKSIGINFIDVYFRKGVYKAATVPYTPGVEACGVVTAVGPGLTGRQVGDLVAYAGQPMGSYAEEQILPANRVVPVPPSIDPTVAASLLLKESRQFNEDSMEEDDSEDVSEPESEPESEDEEDVKLTEPSKKAIFNRDGLLDKLGDISWPENAGWVHKLSVDIDQEKQVDVNDDLTRELAFYTQALEGTRKAFEKLQSMGLPFFRPEDYYAEMVKTDSHMERVKSRLLVEKKKIEEADERRKARDAKKLSKEIQAQKLKERAKQKKEDIESVKKWRKQRQQSGFAGGDKGSELDLAFEDGKPFEKSSNKRPGVAPGDRSGGKARQGVKSGKKPKKRDIKDSKFGYGGRKGSKKQNMAETTNDLRGFNTDSLSGNRKRKR